VKRPGILVFLLLAVSASGQVNQRVPDIRILLPPEIPSDKVLLWGYLYGSFGTFGLDARAAQNMRSIPIHPTVKGEVADRLKLLAWAPGCRIATFEIAIRPAAVQESYSCRPLPMVTLQGQVAVSKALQARQFEVKASYSADWACDFFGIPSCTGPPIQIGTARLDSDGRFEIRLSDLAADPASSGRGTFQFVLTEVKTQNFIAVLQPESISLQNRGGLKPASSYPRPVVFVEIKRGRLHGFTGPNLR